MEIKHFEVNSEHFLVHFIIPRMFNDNKMRYEGSVYWAVKHNENDVFYESDNEGILKTYSELNDDCKKAFDFQFCWRGVWEDRVYMKNDEELYCGELRDLADLWDEIEKCLKEKIKSDNPDYGGFDD